MQKIKHFLYNFTSIDSFLIDWKHAFNSKDEAYIERFLDKEKTRFFIEKIKEDKIYYFKLHADLEIMVTLGNDKIIRKMIASGISMNYAQPNLLSLILHVIKPNNRDKMYTTFQSLLDCGFDVNDLNYKNEISSYLHKLVDKLSNQRIIKAPKHSVTYYYHTTNKYTKYFYSQDDDSLFITKNVYYPLLKMILNNNVELNFNQEII